ncbi:cytochrome c-type biogenesis protein [Flexibacterium corallicola]|uniref:cytochrome c-type biogenesis protein n=1 Tax=Flexibacterium corallicola TaxID=3037259 RepID=UPI00286F7969|nr:cytochrome c-type biogenesis protein [Pseudovibrio sp. M1P-2-3]
MKRLVFSAVASFFLLFGGAAYAVNPNERLDDPALEQRARDLSLEIRCVVCQNQSIDDSNAELAKDLRLLVRERLVKGDSDAQVLDFLVSRYGEFILLKPRFAPHTWVLWGAGPAILLIGGGLLVYVARRRRKSDATPQKTGPAELTDEEKKELEKLFNQE